MKHPLHHLVRRLPALAVLALAALLAACHTAPPTPAATALPPPSPTATASATPTPSSTPSPTPSATPSPAPTPTATPCAAEVCVLPWAFPLQRPIAPPNNSAIAPTYRFGSDYHGLREPHHGVDMGNPQGTPVEAAAAGVVVFAGSDAQTVVGLFPNFYGQVVVIRHENPVLPQPLFTVYGHLETVAVHIGQTVRAGELIGTVGSRGVAVGPHLHFEVRLGENTYDAAQNPELWLQMPEPNQGALAMRLTTPEGTLRRLTAIVVRGLDDGLPTYYLETYADAFPGDPRLHENLAIGALPAGRYQVEITCCGRLYRRDIAIEAEHLTFVRLALPQP